MNPGVSSVMRRRLSMTLQLACLSSGCADRPTSVSSNPAQHTLSGEPAVAAPQDTTAPIHSSADASPSSSASDDQASRCPSSMALVASGEFAGTRGPPGPIVRVDAFCMDRTEVTVQAYKSCVDSGQCGSPSGGIGCNWGAEGRFLHPMNCIDYDEAVHYCAHTGARLPTSIEWRWAARGRERGWSFPWGNATPSGRVCWSGDERRDSTCAVRSFNSGASPDGLYDLSGNVMEYTSTPFAEADITTERGQVVHGGAWNDTLTETVRADVESWMSSTARRAWLGFRCVAAARSKSSEPTR